MITQPSERHRRTARFIPFGALFLTLAACRGQLSDGSGEPGSSFGSAAGGGSVGAEPDMVRPPVGTFGGPIVSRPSGASRFSLLNQAQWENSVKDALKLVAPLGLSKAFVAAPLRSTFDTNGSLLTVSADGFRDYQLAAEALATTVAHDATLLARFAPTLGDASSLIKNLGRRAFRRPLADDEVSRAAALFARGGELIASGNDFSDGVELVAAYLFQSPHFLYRTELSSTIVDGKIPLNGYEVAAKLAYALTGSMPDDTLVSAADAGALSLRGQVVAEATRLLGTKAAAEVVANFHDQLLVMREYDQISKAARFPGFDEGVGADLKGEAQAFIHDLVFSQDRGFQTLMTAPYTFANARVRGLYGLENQAPVGAGPTEFSRLELDPGQRAGLLTQLGFLTANAEQDMPNIIIRGVHIARRLLCSPLPAPPDAVPPLPAPLPNSTNRQRVTALTRESPCSGCHATIINPLGFALETLDGTGKYRTQDNALPVDATASYELDGQAVNFTGPVELSRAIAGSDQAHACYAQHWAEYLYGRSVEPDQDLSLIQQGGWLSRDRESVKTLIVNLLATDAFLARLPG